MGKRSGQGPKLVIPGSVFLVHQLGACLAIQICELLDHRISFCNCCFVICLSEVAHLASCLGFTSILYTFRFSFLTEEVFTFALGLPLILVVTKGC